jgi:hypothetical protein
MVLDTVMVEIEEIKDKERVTGLQNSLFEYVFTLIDAFSSKFNAIRFYRYWGV